MSNPILRPNDPRFQRPTLQDAEGKNRFAETAEVAAEVVGNEPFAPPADGEARPFVPQYEEQQQPRAGLLLLLALLGWAGAALGVVSLTGLYDSGWICPLLAIAPAAAAWLLAHQDLRAIEVGAIGSAAYRATRRAHWLGATALAAALATTIGMILLARNFLPEGL